MNLKDREKLEKLFDELYENILSHFKFMFQALKDEGRVKNSDKNTMMYVAKLIYDDYKKMTYKHLEEMDRQEQMRKDNITPVKHYD